MSGCSHRRHPTARAPIAPGSRYTCPMHPEVMQDGAGDCPLCGMALEPVGAAAEDGAELRDMTLRMWVAAGLTVPAVVLSMAHMFGASAVAHWGDSPMGRWVQALIATMVLFGVGWPFLRRAWMSVVNRAANMFTLVATGTLAAWGFSLGVLIFPGAAVEQGLYFEAAAVIITLVLVGQVLELRARQRTGDALRALMDLAPATAEKLMTDGEWKMVPLIDVSTGDVLRVKPGGKVPVDGTILEGRSAVDESMLTGESVPVEAGPGSKVRAGTMNGPGSFDLRATGVGADTLLAQIVETVAQAQRARAPVQDLADRVSAIFVPLVFLSALAAFLLWWVLTGSWAMALTTSVAVLIIACPCAIGLAVPMSIAVGVGRAARAGVLVRQPSALERLEKTDTLCLDKTGTLTEGRPIVTEVVCGPEFTEKLLWRVAAVLESRSEHPLAAAVVRAARERGVGFAEGVEDFQSSPGRGVSGCVGKSVVRVGSPEFVGVEGAEDLGGRSRIDVSVDGRWAGTFFLEDPLKPTAREAVENLRRRGLRLVLLSGDRETVVGRVAASLGIADFRAGLSPSEKAAVVAELRAQGRVVCMAGDGVNDAPALAAADCSVAMGAGSDVAKETADLVLVKGSLDALVRSFDLGRAIMRNVRQNLFLALVYNFLGIPLAAGVLYPLTGWLLSPMVAGAAMSLSSVSVIANALRLGRVRIGT